MPSQRSLKKTYGRSQGSYKSGSSQSQSINPDLAKANAESDAFLQARKQAEIDAKNQIWLDYQKTQEYKKNQEELVRVKANYQKKLEQRAVLQNQQFQRTQSRSVPIYTRQAGMTQNIPTQETTSTPRTQISQSFSYDITPSGFRGGTIAKNLWDISQNPSAGLNNQMIYGASLPKQTKDYSIIGKEPALSKQKLTGYVDSVIKFIQPDLFLLLKKGEAEEKKVIQKEYRAAEKVYGSSYNEKGQRLNAEGKPSKAMMGLTSPTEAKTTREVYTAQANIKREEKGLLKEADRIVSDYKKNQARIESEFSKSAQDDKAAASANSNLDKSYQEANSKLNNINSKLSRGGMLSPLINEYKQKAFSQIEEKRLKEPVILKSDQGVKVNSKNIFGATFQAGQYLASRTSTKDETAANVAFNIKEGLVAIPYIPSDTLKLGKSIFQGGESLVKESIKSRSILPTLVVGAAIGYGAKKAGVSILNHPSRLVPIATQVVVGAGYKKLSEGIVTQTIIGGEEVGAVRLKKIGTNQVGDIYKGTQKTESILRINRPLKIFEQPKEYSISQITTGTVVPVSEEGIFVSNIKGISKADEIIGYRFNEKNILESVASKEARLKGTPNLITGKINPKAPKVQRKLGELYDIKIVPDIFKGKKVLTPIMSGKAEVLSKYQIETAIIPLSKTTSQSLSYGEVVSATRKGKFTIQPITQRTMNVNINEAFGVQYGLLNKGTARVSETGAFSRLKGTPNVPKKLFDSEQFMAAERLTKPFTGMVTLRQTIKTGGKETRNLFISKYYSPEGFFKMLETRSPKEGFIYGGSSSQYNYATPLRKFTGSQNFWGVVAEEDYATRTNVLRSPTLALSAPKNPTPVGFNKIYLGNDIEMLVSKRELSRFNSLKKLQIKNLVEKRRGAFIRNELKKSKGRSQKFNFQPSEEAQQLLTRQKVKQRPSLQQKTKHVPESKYAYSPLNQYSNQEYNFDYTGQEYDFTSQKLLGEEFKGSRSRIRSPQPNVIFERPSAVGSLFEKQRGLNLVQFVNTKSLLKSSQFNTYKPGVGIAAAQVSRLRLNQTPLVASKSVQVQKQSQIPVQLEMFKLDTRTVSKQVTGGTFPTFTIPKVPPLIIIPPFAGSVSLFGSSGEGKNKLFGRKRKLRSSLVGQSIGLKRSRQHLTEGSFLTGLEIRGL